MKPKMKAILSVLSLVILYGCNTVEGAGADIKGAGRAIESSAAQTKSNM